MQIEGSVQIQRARIEQLIFVAATYQTAGMRASSILVLLLAHPIEMSSVHPSMPIPYIVSTSHGHCAT